MKTLLKLLIFLLIIGAIGYFVFIKFFQTEPENPGPILRENTTKEVEVFDLKNDKAELYLSKSGQTASDIMAKISPQISGLITKINVKVGQVVKKDDILLTLGDSLSTDLIDLQYDSSGQAQNLAEASQMETWWVAYYQTVGADIGVEIAFDNYKNALKTKKNTIKTFDGQFQNTEIELDNASLALDKAEEDYDDAKDDLYELEDELDDIRNDIDDLDAIGQDTSELEDIENELEQALDMSEDKVDGLKLALNLAENRYDQGEIALSQLEKTFKIQCDQLDFATEIALDQYNAALNQFNLAQSSAKLQELGAESQLLQANTALKSAKLTADQKNVSSPISGIVTDIAVETGNLVTPGQVLIKIENDTFISVITSVNLDEAKLISPDAVVTVEINNQSIEGEILSINPTLNEKSKKIEIEVIIPKNNGIIAGSFAKVNFPLDQKIRKFIPLNSVFLDENQKLIKIVNSENRVEFKEIQTGEIINDFIEVTEGLDGDEILITTVETFLHEGDKVKIIND